MKILSIDQARSGAWSIFDYETKKLIDYDTFCYDSKKYTYAKAVLNIEQLIAEIIRTHDISAVFIEDIQLRANVQAFKRLAQLQGVLVNLFEKNEYLYDFVVPTQWQNFCRKQVKDKNDEKDMDCSIPLTAKKKSKMESIKFIKDMFDIETDNDNLADAICIGWYVVNMVEIQTITQSKKKK